MEGTDYEKYLVRKPLFLKLFEGVPEVKNRQSPPMIYMSNAQVPGADKHVEFSWIQGMPDPNPHIFEMRHNFDEIVLHIGGDPDNPQDLGGEIEFYIGGQPITFNTTTTIFVPRGLSHGPLTWKKFRQPHIQLSIIFGTGDTHEAWDESGAEKAKNELPHKTTRFDYEQYVVRSPLREAGANFSVKNRQSPSMTYMSRRQVLEANYYIEFGWIYGMPEPNPHILRHRHDYDELVLHIGGDPRRSEDLGGEIDYYVGGQLLTFDTTSVLFVPKGLVHGPLTWKKFKKPHIEMAVMTGAGNLREVWGNSGYGKI
jgi:hypothetical protein